MTSIFIEEDSDQFTFLQRHCIWDVYSVMAPSVVKWGGRVVFFALLATQCCFLAAYPVHYKGNCLWCGVGASYVPATVLWLCFLAEGNASLLGCFYVWAVYVCCALLPNIIVIFGFLADSLEKETFLGPNVFKMVLCITPLLLLLLLNTADYGDEDTAERGEVREEVKIKSARKLLEELASKLCVQVTLDLFDAIEMLDIVLDEMHGKERMEFNGLGKVMIVGACFSFLLSLLQMAETEFSQGKAVKPRYKTTMVSTIARMICINLVFLVIRAVVFFKYGKDESIFIAKNGIAIIRSYIEISHLVRKHRQCSPHGSSTTLNTDKNGPQTTCVPSSNTGTMSQRPSPRLAWQLPSPC